MDREIRLSVRGDVERIEERARGQEDWRPGGIAIFSCSGRGIYEEVELPREIRDRIVLDTSPWVRTMLAVLDEYERMCVVIADRGAAQMWELYQDELSQVGKRRDRTLRKPDYAAGLDEDRVRNRADELAKRHYRKTVELLDELFRTDGYDLLAVGGHQYEVSTFVDFLTYDLRKLLAGTFTVDPATAGPADIHQHATAILDDHVREEERRRVAEVVETVAARGRAVLGVAGCLWAGTVAAIDTLLVQDDAVVPGVVCDNDNWMAEAGTICPLCGNLLRQTTDVLDELAETVVNESGSIKHVKSDTELKEHLAGASLRFPLPPLP
jgi:peptide chain release factor subunit 1